MYRFIGLFVYTGSQNVATLMYQAPKKSDLAKTTQAIGVDPALASTQKQQPA